VIACDNAIPHLLADAEIEQAFRSMRDQLAPGGIAVISVRDYAGIERRDADVRPYGARRQGGARYLAVQVWDWEGDQYDLSMYLTEERANGACTTRVMKTRYYAVTIDRLTALMNDAGFVDVTRHDRAFFQPVLVGHRNG